MMRAPALTLPSLTRWAPPSPAVRERGLFSVPGVNSPSPALRERVARAQRAAGEGCCRTPGDIQ
jgi:hypothetical protein